MSNVTAPPPATPTGQGGGQGGAAQQQSQGQPQTQTPAPAPHSTSAVSLAGTLAGIDIGARLAGLILGSDAAGQSVLRTDQGTFVIVGRGPMPANTQLQIQVLSVGPTIQAMVLARDGKPLHPPMSLTLELAKPAAQPATATPTQTPAATPTQTAPLPVLQPGAQINATVLPQAVPGTAATALPPSTALTLQVITVTPPPSIPTATTQPPAAPLPQAVRHPASPVLGLRAYGQVAPPTAGSTPPAGTAPPSLPSAAPPPALPNPTITATVIGRNDGGQLTVRSPAGLLALNTTTDLAPGSRITLQVVRQDAPTQPLPQPQNQPQPLPEAPPLRLPATGPAALAGLLRNWPTLEQSVEQLKAVDHGMFQRVMVDTVPTPTARLASAMLLFISALRGGDLSTWLGADALRQVEQRARPDLAGRMGDEFQRFAAVATEPGGGDWRMFAIPLFDGWRWYQLQLFARRHRRRHDDGSEGEEETRFVLDFDLSRLGGMQLDGLVREKHFDLIIRSETPLTQVMRDDIGRIFTEALEIGGCAGSCAFQTGKPFPIDPLAEMSHPDDGPATDPATVTV